MISVIVPVYNSEKYIDRCVNSVISQSYREWELLLINDGSSDNSLQKLLVYEKKDKRIKVIHQENAGAGAARNKGLEYASGEYIVFVDSDDYIENNYFELLSNHKEDVVFIDVNRRSVNGNKKNVIERLSDLEGKTKDEILRMQMTGKMLWGGVRKAAKRDLIEKNHIRYSTHKVGEEAIYSFLLLYYAEDFSFIREPVYNYEVRIDSLSQSYNLDPWGPVSVALREKVEELGCYEIYADTLNAFIKTALIVSLRNIARNTKMKEYLVLVNEKIARTDGFLDNRYVIDKNHMSLKAKIILSLLNKRMFRVIYLLSKIK